MIKTILFDLDGTLIDSPPLILEGLKQTFNKFLPHIDFENIDQSDLVGHPIYRTLETYNYPSDEVAGFIQYYRDLTESWMDEKLKAYPNAYETLKNLKNKNIKIGVVTSKHREVARRHLKITNLAEFIDFIVGYEDTKNHKPDPDPLLKGAELAKSKINETVYVGDHENDIFAAKNANMRSCAVLFSKRETQLIEANPTFKVKNLIEILDFI